MTGDVNYEHAMIYRAKMQAVLATLCQIIEDAKNDGFLITYITGDDKEGRQSVRNIEILKRY